MPIAKVQGPDGKIHRFEVPDGATPEEIEDFAANNINMDAPAKSEYTPSAFDNPFQPVLAGAIKGIPMGADIAGAAAAAFLPNPNETPFMDRQRAAKALFDEKGKQAFEEFPGAATAGTLGTGVMAGMLTPARALQAPSAVGRATKGGLVGAGYGSAYGFGEGDNLNERVGNAITGGFTGAPFGALGNTAADIVGAGYRMAGSLSERAAKVLGGIRRQQPNISQGAATSTGVVGALTAPPQQPLSNTAIPLTQGNLTQAPKQQALEAGAAAGIYGDDARNLAMQTREIQSDAAKNVLSGIAGKELTADVPLDATAALTQNLKRAYSGAKAKTNAAYGKVGELSQDEPLQIAASYIRDGIIPSFKDWARKGNGMGFDLMAPDMANGKRLYDQATALGDMKKLSGANFQRMEQWRGRVSQGIANSKVPAEKAFLSGMLQRYDTAMNNLPREAIKSGDEAIIGAMEKARMARKEQGVLFERSKLVKDILQNDDLTNEQFANVITSLGPKSGTYVRDILRTAATDPAKQQELQQQIKQAVLGNILNKSLSAELKAGSSITSIDNMVSFDKLTTELGKLIKNRTLFERVVSDPAERKAIIEAYNASALIKSTKPGTKNYSNSAYTLLNVVRSISPSMTSANVFGLGVGTSLKAMGEAGATQELTKSLAPVLKGVVEQNNLVTNFGKKYGRQIMTGAAQGGQQSLNEIKE